MGEAPVTIVVRKNGSYRITGPFRLVDYEGNEWDLSGKETVSLCRCGASKKKPFCDGSHKIIGFQAAEKATDSLNSPAVAPAQSAAQLIPQK